MRKKLLFMLVMVAALSLSLGCTSGGEKDNELENNAGAKTITDSLGREVVIAKYPEKVISIAPAITEILFAIGLDEEIIGVSDYCDYPEKALTKEKVGGFKDPNVEVIVEKNPDVVFASAGVQEELISKLEELSITVAVLDADTMEQVMENILITGGITGKEAAAEEVINDMEERRASIAEKVKELPQPKVFFEIWDDPLMSAGSTSFIHQLIEDAGGINVAAGNSERYYNFSMENLLEADPDIYVINTHSHTPDDIINRNGYQVLSAVKKNQVFTIDDNLISRAGPRVIQGLEQMAKIIHPGVFK